MDNKVNEMNDVLMEVRRIRRKLQATLKTLDDIEGVICDDRKTARQTRDAIKAQLAAARAQITAIDKAG